MSSKASVRAVVIGGGAIGGITAAFLSRAGHDVTLVCKHCEIADMANGQGLHIKGVRGDHHIPVPAVTDISGLEGRFDLCLIATKAYDMPDCAAAILPYLNDGALVLSMQNGICTDALAEKVGVSRTVGCVVGFGATMEGPGELVMTSTGEFVIGLTDRSHPALLDQLKDMLSDVVPARISDDIFAELYSKLIVNSCITSLGAVCGLRLGEMMRDRRARSIFLAIIGEAVKVAEAMDLTIPPYGGRLDYHALMRGSRPLDDLRRHLTIRVVGLKYHNLKSSSLQSLERGRPTEIEYFNGYIVKKGRENGVPCPINERMTEMVHEIERKERPITPDNLADSRLTV